MTAVDMVEAFVGFGSSEPNEALGDLNPEIPPLDADAVEAQAESTMQHGEQQAEVPSPEEEEDEPVIPVGSPFPANRYHSFTLTH